MPVKMCCTRCGSDEVWADANAVWDVDTQEWVLNNVFDMNYCETCDKETHLDEAPIP